MSFRPRINKLASETAIYGVSSVFGRLINFLLFPFYSNVFAPDVYGPVIVVYAAFVFLNIIYQYGMEASYLKFAANATQAEEKKITFSTAVWSLFLTASVFSACIYFFKAPVGGLLGLEPPHFQLLNFAAGILMLDTLMVVPYAELRLQNKPWRFAFIRTAGIVVNVALNLIFILVLEMGIEAIFLANLLASGTSFLLLSPSFASHFRLLFSRKQLRELLRFGLPFVPGGLGYALSGYVNIFFLERMDGDRILELYGSDPAVAALASKAATEGASIYAEFVVGAYGGMIKLAIILALFVQMFRYAWQPFFLQHADDDDAPALFGRVLTLYTAVLLVVFLAVSFLAQELVSLPLPGGRHIIASSYWIGLSIIPIALLGYVFQGWYYHFSAGAYIKNKTRYFVTCTLIGSAVALGMNFFLVPDYGMAAAAWATASSFALMAVSLLLFVQRIYPVPYEWPKVIVLVVGAVIAFFTWKLTPSIQIWWIELLFLAGFSVLALLVTGARKSRILSGN